MLRKTFFAGLAALIMASSANAAVIFGLSIDPTTTAGANSNSTRTGAGTWHLYAIDNSPSGSSGISSFDVGLVTATGTMAINNRAPATNYDADGGGTAVPAGFNLLRQSLGNNTAAIELTGAQPTPPSADSSANKGVDYFPISGYGQTAGSFATAYSQAILGPTTGAAWGNYTDGGFASPEAAAANPGGAFKWVFIGEGTYTGAKPIFGVASSTIYSNFSNSFASIPPAGGTSSVIFSVPEPACISLLGLAMVGGLGLIRRRHA